MIVTSPLLSDTLSIHTKQQKYHHTPPPFHSAAAHTRSGKIGTIATLSGLFVALGIERFVPSRIKTVRNVHSHNAIVSFTPTITMTLASGVSLYFIYRHMVGYLKNKVIFFISSAYCCLKNNIILHIFGSFIYLFIFILCSLSLFFFIYI